MTITNNDLNLKKLYLRTGVGVFLIILGTAIGIWGDVRNSDTAILIYGAKVYFWALPPVIVGIVLLIGEWLIVAYDRSPWGKGRSQ